MPRYKNDWEPDDHGKCQILNVVLLGLVIILAVEIIFYHWWT